MKKVLIPVTSGAFARNFLRAGIVGEARRAGLSLVLYVPKEKLGAYAAEFGGDGVLFEALPSTTSRCERFFDACDKWSIHSRFMLLHHLFFLTRAGARGAPLRRFPIFVVRLCAWCLGGAPLFRTVVRAAYAAVRAPHLQALLAAHQPSLVFCPSLLHGAEWQFLKEARRLGIPTVGMTASWDNLCSKTFIRVFPDRLLVQNELLKWQAVTLADYPKRRITIVGAPHYDRHFRREGVISRGAFFKSIHADPSRKLILYAFSGKVGEAVDDAMLSVLQRIMQTHAWGAEAQVLVRPYPKRNFSHKKAAWVRDTLWFLIAESGTAVGEGKDKWELDGQALQFMANSLAHADVVITTCSTFFVEAAIFGAPLIGISFDGGLRRNRWNSVRRVRQWEHIASLERTGGVPFVESEEAFARALGASLADRTLRAAEREQIVKEQAAFTDGKSLARIVAALRAALCR